jgi:hypothetical protein
MDFKRVAGPWKHTAGGEQLFATETVATSTTPRSTLRCWEQLNQSRVFSLHRDIRLTVPRQRTLYIARHNYGETKEAMGSASILMRETYHRRKLPRVLEIRIYSFSNSEHQ